MTKADEFRSAIEWATAETPYGFTPTENGFELHLNLADAKWYGLFNKARLKSDYVCMVEVGDEDYSIEQRLRRVSWTAGVPTHGELEFFRGRAYQFKMEKVWALDENFRPAKVVDYTFSSGESLELIRTVGKKLGLRERMPMSMKVGLGFALVGLSSVVVVPLAFAGKALGWWG